MSGGLRSRASAGTHGTGIGQTARDAVPVEPAELDRRPTWSASEVMVDDHVRYYVPRDGSNSPTSCN